jgi:hypothetical protein
MSKNSTDIVLKNHIQHLDWLPDPSLVTEFKQVDWTTIVLLRRDLFKMALSLAVSEKTGQWMKYHDVPAFEIDSNDFKTSLDYVLDMTRAVIHNKYDFKYHQVIFYEGLSFNHQNDFNKLHISKYFDYERRRELLPNYPLFHDKLRWVNQAPAKEQQILNYHDLQTYSISILIRDRRFGVKGTKLVNVVCKMN